MFNNIGEIVESTNYELLIAVSGNTKLVGALVYSVNLKESIEDNNKSGYRLLAVNEQYRNIGVGRKLMNDCIRRVKTSSFNQKNSQSTKFSIRINEVNKFFGFKRFNNVDFIEDKFLLSGFQLIINEAIKHQDKRA